jgi:hypothetical protein
MDEESIKFRAFLNSDKGETNYFEFEQDFMENNMRCIPMLVRFKLDAVGIKLKIREWSKFTLDEKIDLAIKPCVTPAEIRRYHNELNFLIKKYTAGEATMLNVDFSSEWEILESVPENLQLKAAEFGWKIKLPQWKSLNNLQRFALLKLCRPGHENVNFPKAYREFGMI